MQDTTPQDPDKAPDETYFEQLAELTALDTEDDDLGPADLQWPLQDPQDIP